MKNSSTYPTAKNIYKYVYIYILNQEENGKRTLLSFF